MRHTIVFAFLALFGCQAIQTATDAETAANLTNDAVAAHTAKALVLTQVEKDACAAQAGFNVATDYYLGQSDTAAAQISSALSAVAGKACQWQVS